MKGESVVDFEDAEPRGERAVSMGNEKDPEDSKKGDLRPVLELVPDGLKPPSAQKRRLLELPPLDADDAILYQHTVLCQTSLPYRNPGDEIRLWSRRNGYVKLELQAGRAYDGRVDDFVDVGLPFGPKPRLVLPKPTLRPTIRCGRM